MNNPDRFCSKSRRYGKLYMTNNKTCINYLITIIKVINTILCNISDKGLGHGEANMCLKPLATIPVSWKSVLLVEETGVPSENTDTGKFHYIIKLKWQ